MASIFGVAPDYGSMPEMPPSSVGNDRLPAGVVEIPDDDDDNNNDDEDVIELGTLRVPNQGVHQNRPSAGSSATMNIRTKPDTSPATNHDNKRQKLDNAPEPSGSHVQYPRTRIEFIDTDDGFTQFYPDFFDDAFLFDYRDTASNSSIDTAAKVLEQQAIHQAQPPPYYEDAKIKIRMYCGPGYEKFPLPISYDPKFQQACDRYDAGETENHQVLVQQDPRITIPQQDCLLRVLDVFPDIEHKFVLDKIKAQCETIQFPDEEIEMHPDSAAIINQVLEIEKYPKQPDPEDDKPHEFEDRLGKQINWTRDHYQNPNYKTDTVALLATHFEHVPTHFINSTVIQKGSLFDAFVVIDEIESNYFQGKRPYSRSKRPRVQLEKKYQKLKPELNPPYYCQLVVELQASKQHVLRKKLQSNQKQQVADAEVANLEQHRLDGLLVQCNCCFDDEVPMNRVVVCLADEEHPFCYDCVRNLAENQIGMRRYEMQCMDESGCNKTLELDGIGKAVPIKTFDRLQFNQQQAEIKAANIDGLEQCPLCDFQAICDPPEVDTIFSCQNPDCFKVTCRLCHEISHRPKTCEEAKKDRGLSARHKVEEARTQAMIRTCPNCQSGIVKSDGCNKMRCTCGTVICYACKTDLSKTRDAYDHFDRGTSSGKKCPLYDDKTVDRHVVEANEAEERAILEVKAQDGTIEEDALRIETGKGKGVDRGKRQDLIAGALYGARAHVGHWNEQDLQADVDDLAQDFDIRAAPPPGRRRQFMRNHRNARRLQDLRPNLPLGQAPPNAGFGHPPAVQPPAPVLPQYQYQNDQIAPLNLRQPQNHPYLPQPSAFGPLLNQDPMNAFNRAPQPQMNDPNFFNAAYINTAQRIHDFRDQQEQRRRGQVERRNTFENQAPPQLPNPNILNVRNNSHPLPFFAPNELQQDHRRSILGAGSNNGEVPYFRPDDGLQLGRQPFAHAVLNVLHRNQNRHQDQYQEPPQQAAAPTPNVNFELSRAQAPNTGRPRTWRNQDLMNTAPNRRTIGDRDMPGLRNAHGMGTIRGPPNTGQIDITMRDSNENQW